MQTIKYFNFIEWLLQMQRKYDISIEYNQPRL